MSCFIGVFSLRSHAYVRQHRPLSPSLIRTLLTVAPKQDSQDGQDNPNSPSSQVTDQVTEVSVCTVQVKVVE